MSQYMSREDAAAQIAFEVARFLTRHGGSQDLSQRDELVAALVAGKAVASLPIGSTDVSFLVINGSPTEPFYDMVTIAGSDGKPAYGLIHELEREIGIEALSAFVENVEDIVLGRIMRGFARLWQELNGVALHDHTLRYLPRLIRRGRPYSFVDDFGHVFTLGQVDPNNYILRVFQRVSDSEGGMLFESSAISREWSARGTAYVTDSLGGLPFPIANPAPVFTEADDTAARIGAVIKWLWPQDMSQVPYPAHQHDEFVAKLRAGAAASIHGSGDYGNARIIVDLPDANGNILRVHTREGFADDPKWRPYRYSTEIFNLAVVQHVGREAVLALLGAK